MNLDWVHLHLMVNHLPVVLVLLGAVACIVALATKRDGVWTYAAFTVLLAGLLAPVALLTGDKAEHEAEDAWYTSGAVIHEHEEAGEVAMWSTVVAGALGIVALRRKELAWRLALSVLSLVAAVAMTHAALEGSKIVHLNPVLEQPPPGVVSTP